MRAFLLGWIPFRVRIGIYNLLVAPAVGWQFAVGWVLGVGVIQALGTMTREQVLTALRDDDQAGA